MALMLDDALAVASLVGAFQSVKLELLKFEEKLCLLRTVFVMTGLIHWSGDHSFHKSVTSLFRSFQPFQQPENNQIPL